MTPIKPIRTLIVARTDRLGDVVISSSCLGPVRAHFPGARIHWLVPDRFRPLFHNPASADSVLTPGPGGMVSRAFRLARAMRGLRADTLAILQPDRTIELAGILAGVRIRAGFARARCWPQFLTDAAPYRKSEGAKHEGFYNFEVLRLIDVPEPARLEPALSPDPEAAARLAHRTGFAAAQWKNCAALHLAAHGAKTRIPLEAFASLAGWLKREPGLRPVLIGTEADPSLATIAGAAGMAADEFIDLRGVTDLAETAWLLRHAALCVGRDSGPVHLAAAMGCPTLALFADPRPILGPTRWRPLGPRVEILPAETSSDFEAVRAAAARLLQRHHPIL